MSEQSDEDKDLPATERKLQKAREEGNIPRSKELSAGVVVLAGTALLFLLGEKLVSEASHLIRSGMTLDRSMAFDSKLMGTQFFELMLSSLWILAPLFITVFLAATFASVLLGGMNWAPKKLKPKFSTLDPIKGLKNIFSSNGLAEFVKAILKTVLIGFVGGLLIYMDMDSFTSMAAMPLDESLTEAINLVILNCLILSGCYFFIVIFDAPYQLWRHLKQLRMSQSEVKKEHKEVEGDPYLKAKIRSIQRQMAQARMMQALPEASVVVVNPRHFAVALKYEQDGERPPVVVAKGVNSQAFKIREVAEQHDVPIAEVPALARALYANVEIDQEIPSLLYEVVAKLLAYLFAIKRGDYSLDSPLDREVPEELDPHSEAYLGKIQTKQNLKNLRKTDTA